jgi:hypothetical protein
VNLTCFADFDRCRRTQNVSNPLPRLGVPDSADHSKARLIITIIGWKRAAEIAAPTCAPAYDEMT